MGLCGTACLSHNSGKTELATAIANCRPPKARLVSLIYPSDVPSFDSVCPPPKFEEVEIFSGIPGNLHLFGTTAAKFNLLGTDEQGRDQFSSYCMEVALVKYIGIVGIAITFPLGMIIGGISGYFGGWIDSVLMRLVEVLMTIPSIYLLVALAAVLPPG